MFAIKTLVVRALHNNLEIVIDQQTSLFSATTAEKTAQLRRTPRLPKQSNAYYQLPPQ